MRGNQSFAVPLLALPVKTYNFMFCMYFTVSLTICVSTNLNSRCKVGINVALNDSFRFVVQKLLVIQAVVSRACAFGGIV